MLSQKRRNPMERSQNLTEIIENILGFKLAVSVTNEPIPIRNITLFNGIPKEEGAMATKIAYSKDHAMKLLSENIKNHVRKDHSSWHNLPTYSGDNIVCRINIW